MTQPVDRAAPGIDPASKWLLLSVLGGSQLATTYLAVAETGRHGSECVVFKLLAFEVTDEQAADHLRAERDRLSGLKLSGAAAMIDAGVTASGNPYFVFEHAPGQRLDAYVRRHRLDAGERHALFSDVAGTIGQAHLAGIAHGALHATNVRVTVARGVTRPMVLDLGVRQFLSALKGSPISKPAVADDRDALAALARDLE